MLLALETSDRNCSVCVADPVSGTIVASITEDIGRGHAERLMGMIGAALGDAGIAYTDLTKIAVCVGPGSFTGIRVALATATGLSIALGVPVTGVTALQAHALEAASTGSGKPIAVLIDAHRGDVYLQNFDTDALPVDASRQIALADLPELPSAAFVTAGPGANLVAHEATAATSGPPAVINIARAALDPRFTVEAKPLYLRRPDAKPQEAYTVARALR